MGGSMEYLKNWKASSVMKEEWFSQGSSQAQGTLKWGHWGQFNKGILYNGVLMVMGNQQGIYSTQEWKAAPMPIFIRETSSRKETPHSSHVCQSQSEATL